MVMSCKSHDTLPGQWSLITISQYNHSFHPMFPTDHCRLVSTFRRKVRWRSEHVYTPVVWPSVYLQYSDALWRLWFERMTSKMGSELRAPACLTLEMIFLPIKLRVTAASALQSVRYCFPTWNRFTAAVGLRNMLWWQFPHCEGV